MEKTYTDIDVSEKTGTNYDTMEFLVEIFHKTSDGLDFVEVAKRTVSGFSEKELWIIWWAIKARDNQ